MIEAVYKGGIETEAVKRKDSPHLGGSRDTGEDDECEGTWRCLWRYNPVTDAVIAWITALRRSNGDTTIKLILFHSFSLILLNRMSEITKRMTALCFVEHSD